MRLALLLLALAGVPALAADPNTPHPHKGVLAKYPTPPAAVTLTSAQEAQLAAGQPVYTTTGSASQGRGVAVFVVNAPPSKVWSTIKSFSSYPRWIDSVETCEVYSQSGDNIYVRFVVSKYMVEAEYYVKHYYPQGQTWGTWTLDYSRTSDLDDSVGSWRVVPYNNDPNRSRVEYSVDIRVTNPVLNSLRGFLVDQGLKDATTWVKAQAER